MSRKVSKDVLNVVNKKINKKVTEQDISKLASKVKPSTTQSEIQLRQLIKQVSTMAGVPVAEKTVQEIIAAIKSSGMNPANIEQLMNMIAKK